MRGRFIWTGEICYLNRCFLYVEVTAVCVSVRVLFGVDSGHVSLLDVFISFNVESHVRACGCVVTGLLRGSLLEFSVSRVVVIEGGIVPICLWIYTKSRFVSSLGWP